MPDDMPQDGLQAQLDELRMRIDELEAAVYEDEESPVGEPGEGRMKAGKGLALMLGGGE